jgi:hypothetical protein
MGNSPPGFCIDDDKHWADTGTTDSDHDGLSDEFERNVVGTDPFDRDSDDDGLNDNRERDFGTNPRNPTPMATMCRTIAR